MYKVTIFNSYSIGYRIITFSKKIELPFSPFYGLRLFGEDGDESWEIYLKETNGTIINIDYEIYSNEFTINVRNNALYYSWDSINNIIHEFSTWEMNSNPTINEIKEYINQNN